MRDRSEIYGRCEALVRQAVENAATSIPHSAVVRISGVSGVSARTILRRLSRQGEIIREGTRSCYRYRSTT